MAKSFSGLHSSDLSGVVKVPGDKSISHRAIIFGALATGETEITGLLEAEDVISTTKAVSALGANVKHLGPGHWLVSGLGIGGMTAPTAPLDFGNSGTAARLMMGVIAGHNFEAKFIGDESLSRRPMARVLEPLNLMGLNWHEEFDHLPLTLIGAERLMPISYNLPVPSAQVKSAILIAGLFAPGITEVIEEEATRDHTERMLSYFGAKLTITPNESGRTIAIEGDAELKGAPVAVPGDPSSAAFLTAAALLCPGSDITIQSILINPTRTGFYTTLQEMGADITFENERMESGEPIADIRVKASKLTGVDVPAERAPSMIDEYPMLSCLAAFATGETRMRGLNELRVKESDRLKATADGLKAVSVPARIEGDDLIVTGSDTVAGGGYVKTHLDHRIAMSFLILSLASKEPVVVDDISMIKTSFTGFVELMESLGARFK
ncbi:MAG: 3-phosphoshikimate 1-carboxyvinyltransferase [Rhodomicrobium sp.]|nr:MAG: 3-phosphoshikimate 1-carboxyvinyltransferase [Rhodomicrobium sp.]